MSLLHLHLLLNHVPVVGAFLLVVLLVVLLAGATWRRSSELTTLAFWGFAGLGALAIVVFLTGEPAEELLENVLSLPSALVERHEEAARITTIAFAATGSAALLALFAFRRQGLPSWARPLASGFRSRCRQ